MVNGGWQFFYDFYNFRINYNSFKTFVFSIENSNVFVAECKFWNGEAKFMETIGQILGYLTWRDSKAAIVLFVKNQDFTSVINAVKEALPKHSNYINTESEQSEGTILKCKFFLNGDKDRQIFLSVTLFHFPPVVSE